MTTATLPAPTKAGSSWQATAHKPTTPTLRFNAYAWAKLHYLRDLGESEVFAFGISDPNDPLLITDLWIPKQEVSIATAELDEDDLASKVESMGQERPISSFLRVWLHTHPGNDATPSGTDTRTQQEIFGNCEWSLMGILARGGAFHCELAWYGPDKKSQLRVKIPHSVDWSLPFEGARPAAWLSEYKAMVTEDCPFSRGSSGVLFPPSEANAKMGGPLTPTEQQELMYLSEMWEKADPEMTDEMIERLEELELQSNDTNPSGDLFDDDDQYTGFADHKYW
jgi:hypothetical protein